MAEKNGKESSAKDSSVLQNALKQLKMDSEWDAIESKSKDIVLPEELLAGKKRIHRESEDSSSHRWPKPAKDTLKSPSRLIKERSQPYSKDNLPFTDRNIPSIETLSFAEEVCKNKFCTCNQTKGSLVCNSKDEKYFLNFAQASKYRTTTPKKPVQEPHLTLHHKQKDQRVIIRAARLKLAKQFKASFTNALAPKSGGSIPKTAFASYSKESLNYSVLAKSPVGREKNEFSGISFGSYRQDQSAALSKQCDGACSTSSDKFNLTALDEGLPALKPQCPEHRLQNLPAKTAGKKRSPPAASPCPLHPGICSRPCSCSQQALLDPVEDCTVDELACYFDEYVHIPKKMSLMAEMMYT